MGLWTPPNETLVPTSDYSLGGQWSPSPASPTTHYDKVASSDGDTSYLYMTGTKTDYDWFGHTQMSRITGISFLRVGAVVKHYTGNNTQVKVGFSISGTGYVVLDTGNISIPTWRTFTADLATNPANSQKWTKAVVDAMYLGLSPVVAGAACTYVYIEVHFDAINLAGGAALLSLI